MEVSTITKAIVAAAADLGSHTLKEEQLKIVTAFIQGCDVFAVLPTGYWKNLCFGCLPLAFDKLSVETECSCHSLDSHYEGSGKLGSWH